MHSQVPTRHGSIPLGGQIDSFVSLSIHACLSLSQANSRLLEGSDAASFLSEERWIPGNFDLRHPNCSSIGYCFGQSASRLRRSSICFLMVSRSCFEDAGSACRL